MNDPLEIVKELGALCKEKLPPGWHYLIVASPYPLSGGHLVFDHGRSTRDEAVRLSSNFIAGPDGGWTSGQTP